MDLNKYDYKRFEQLLLEMKEYNSSENYPFEYFERQRSIESVIKIMQEYQILINGSTSTTVRGNNEEIET